VCVCVCVCVMQSYKHASALPLSHFQVLNIFLFIFTTVAFDGGVWPTDTISIFWTLSVF